MRWHILFLITFVISWGSNAIAQTESPQSRWTIGIELSKTLQSTNQGQEQELRSFTHHIVGLKSGFRLNRWLEGWVKFQHHELGVQLQSSTVMNLPIFPDELVNRHYTLDMNALLLGVTGLWRIGQGDLGLSAGVGLFRRSGKFEAVSYQRDRLKADIVPVNEGWVTTELSYTYWPTTRFGVSAAIGTMLPAIEAGSSPNIKFPLTNLETSGSGDFDIPEYQTILAPEQLNYVWLWQLTLGVTYRL